MPSERFSDQPPLLITPPAKHVPTTDLQLASQLGPTSSPSSLYSPSAASPTTPRSRAIARPSADLTLACLVRVGVGCTLSWTAVVFGSAVYYSDRYGRAALLYLSAAVYVPGVLVAAIHAAVDGWACRSVGTVQWTRVRMIGGLLLVILLTLAIPCIPDDTSHDGELLLYSLAFALGAASAVPNCCSLDIVSSMRQHYIVALTAGTQLSGLICLALTFLTGLDDSTGSRSTHRLFMLCVAVSTATSLCSALLLQWKSKPWQYVMDRRDLFTTHAYTESEATPLLARSYGSERWQLTVIQPAVVDSKHQHEHEQSAEPIMTLYSDTMPCTPIDDGTTLHGSSATAHLSFVSTFRFVWQPSLALFLTASSSVLLASLYSFAASTSPNLLLVLVYTRLTFDLVGRLVLLLPSVTRCLSHIGSGSTVLLVVAVVRAVLGVVMFCAYLMGWLWLSDAAVCAFIAVMSVSSGLFCTLSYQFAALSVSGVYRSHAAHWMNLSFQGSILAGLVAGFIVRFTMLLNQ